MKNSTKLCLLSVTSLGLTLAVVGFSSNIKMFGSFASPRATVYPADPYSLVLDGTNAPTSSEFSNHTVRTALGNAITVNYINASVLPGGHVHLNAGGELVIATDISGVYQINPLFTGGLKASFGLSDNTLVKRVLESDEEVKLADGFFFNKIKLVATEATDIDSVTLNYSCLSHEDQVTDASNVTVTTTDGTALSKGGAIVTGNFDEPYLDENVYLHVEPFMGNTIESVKLNGEELDLDNDSGCYVYKAGVDDEVVVQTSLKDTITVHQYTIDEGTGAATEIAGSPSEIAPAIDPSGYYYTVNAPTMTGYSPDKDYYKSVLDTDHQEVSFYYSKLDAYDGTPSASLSGSGTSANPWLIKSAEDYVYFVNQVTGGNFYSKKFVKMTTSVDISTLPSANVRAGLSGKQFRGTFDGNNCAVRGVNITSGEKQALFYSVLGGTVKNLCVYGSNQSGVCAGSICSYLDSGGTIQNCSNYMTIKHSKALGGSGNAAGGLVGNMWTNGKIIDCTNYADVTNIDTVNDTNKTAGIVGVIEKPGCLIQNTFNFGNVSGRKMVGGIAPFVNATYNTKIGSETVEVPLDSFTLKDVYNFGEVSCSQASAVSGIMGDLNLTYHTIDGCYNFGDLKPKAGSAGGGCFNAITASTAESNPNTVKDCYNFGNLSATVAGIGGIAGSITNTNNSYPVTFDNCKNYGEIVSSLPNTDAPVGGIVGGALVYHKDSIATTVARLVTFNDCENYGYVDGARRSGGIAGWIGTATFNNCSNYGDLGTRVGAVSQQWNGGIVGTSYNYATNKSSVLTVNNCNNFGKIKTSASAAGGIVGSPSGNATLVIDGCKNYGIVTTASYAGGIVGQTSTAAVSASVSNCINYGQAIASTDYCGGILGNAKFAALDVSNLVNYGRISCPGSHKGNLYPGAK